VVGLAERTFVVPECVIDDSSVAEGVGPERGLSIIGDRPGDHVDVGRDIEVGVPLVDHVERPDAIDDRVTAGRLDRHLCGLRVPRAGPVPSAAKDRGPLRPVVEADWRRVQREEAASSAEVRREPVAERLGRCPRPLGTDGVVSLIGHPEPTRVYRDELELVRGEESRCVVEVVGDV